MDSEYDNPADESKESPVTLSRTEATVSEKLSPWCASCVCILNQDTCMACGLGIGENPILPNGKA